MKYNIFDFSQMAVISLTKEVDGKSISVDVNDLLILQDIADLINRPKMYKYIINDKIYISIQYKAIVSDLPILKIKKQALTDRINKMVLLELLEKEIIKNEQGTFSCFRIGRNYDLLKYDGVGSQIQSPIVSDYDTETITTIKDYTKEDTNVSKKEKEIEIEFEVESKNEDYIKFRKWMKENCQYCDGPKSFKKSKITEEEFVKLKKDFTGAEIADVILNIENRVDLRRKYSSLYLTALNWLKNNRNK